MAKRTKKDETPVTLESPEELPQADSYTPPSMPNEAADPEMPHEETRPETRAERRARQLMGMDVENAETLEN